MPTVMSSPLLLQWNLTCSYQPLVELPNTLYFSGVLLGSVAFGVISDRSVGHVSSGGLRGFRGHGRQFRCG